MTEAILAEGIQKRYGRTVALQGVDLAVPAGSVLGLLGPNGAGKTTTVRILTTLLSFDGGRALVAGVDVAKEPHEVRRRIGLAGQYAAVDEILTGRENLMLLGRLLHLGRRGARARADQLLERFRLTDAADRPVSTYSGGMRRRLDLASSLVTNPPVLFLDEPSTGLDPAARRDLWAAVRDLVSDGVTVLLTTQYLEEADQLADQIAVVSAGRVVANGTPDELKRKVGGERLEIVVARPEEQAAAVEALARMASEPPTVDSRGVIVVHPRSGLDGVVDAGRALQLAGVEVASFALRGPTLDDVFLNLVGSTADR
ncbi:ATP-binding cassette domain-containing protein [Dactylosporangium matsuzakiense]|uniref:Daunorubicin resistance protein DrrA family ABC transporter ATP-binding protein n=1 Tax=Dactylosporangium matsuzakiense TaxID=53360 RepID=A0A9W6KGS5_9ACTN|nr:ATP-binding cassette domain-containing protein [Dactylosporangium matsuzakiense]UWZ42478.1 ATP-binding cassette domain-containing protein [Dactylosporangium matsuzakiense]GLL00607.1 daunorubicin resistance protein DrrA family ABC transporter ATP-binding protein [Dactylosporangium matsuzakiense]